jgi:quercetin dioxygenase-like cupin family protein
MRKALSILIDLSLICPALSSQTREQQPAIPKQVGIRHPMILPLECPSGDCSLLSGVPQTAGMMSGFVRLQPGKSVGWHSTGAHEAARVILSGRGEAQVEGQPDRPIAAPMMAYFPPATRHNVLNNSEASLEYVYLVAPAQPR